MQYDRSTIDGIRKGFAWLLSLALLLVVGISVLKVYEDSARAHERGRLVASIVREQLNAVQSTRLHASSKEASVGQSGTLLEIRKWLVGNVSEVAENPAAVSLKLTDLTETTKISAAEMGTLQRWEQTLGLWAYHEEPVNSLNEKQLLREGRQRYYEAAGLIKTGRPEDATILDLWVISVLTQFVEKNPLNSHMPEALFMLGDSYINLGQSVPAPVKRDRILCLCSELYPDSVWASRADSIWKEESANAI